MAMDQYLYIPFLGGWTSIYQLFWCSPGVQGFDPSPYKTSKHWPSNLHFCWGPPHWPHCAMALPQDPSRTRPGSANPRCWRGGDCAPGRTPPRAGRRNPRLLSEHRWQRWLLGEMATFENIYEKNDDEKNDDDDHDDDDDDDDDDIYCKLRSYLYHRFCRNCIRR